MAQIRNSQRKGRPQVRRYSKSAPQFAVHPYKVVGDPARAITEMKNLPDGVSVALIPSNAVVEQELRRLGSERIQRLPGLVIKAKGRGNVWRRVKPGPTDRTSAVDASAFEPSSRAKALLRGVQIAQSDLKESGGAYDLDQVRILMNGISRQMVDRKVREGSLLAVPGPSNRRAYPTVQFTSDGTVVPGLKAVQEALPTDNPWAVLNFLVRPVSHLNGRKPIDLLKAGEIDLVVDAARRMGQQGS
ncbi:hypothetical protein [Microvirga roseola]|uniref:hypothetical protein n=1 Tax=Microvirga roseola TaxID=2883126 RepID=UPI001E605067|nr:hypothetical protein [Microvirga roseola]